ncbi:MAG: EVE domain-containing protein [Myxococcaceae bacterium]|nr:EVE domain-containing protein [Myxococcaceae bacterium]
MPAKKSWWLIKSEPTEYSFAQLQEDGRTAWTGIRNFAARNNLRAMKPGDLCLYYHTGNEKAVVGLAKVVGKPGPDPTAPGEDWTSVDVAPHKPLKEPVTLAAMKQLKELKGFQLLTHGRLSVVPVTEAQAKVILTHGKTRA